MSKIKIKEIRPYVVLYRCDRTGIAWVEDGTSGNGYSAHPNIHATGSVRGMKARGYWDAKARTVRTHGAIYNVDRIVADADLDKEAAAACRCIGCRTKGGE